jgi:DUF971 family protein
MPADFKRTIPADIYFDGKMHIEWKNGEHTIYDYWELRTACPCAECVDEFTNERILDPNSVSKDIDVHTSAFIGNYGIEIQWSDGHAHGIFTFKDLRDVFPHETRTIN